MKNSFFLSFIFSIQLVFCFKLHAEKLNQEGTTIKYFNNYNSPTVWDGGKTYTFSGGGATVTNVSTNLPVDLTEGNGSMVVETTRPSGWWGIVFRIGSGKSVNYLRIGDNPVIHLKLRWDNIVANADIQFDLYSQPDDQHWNYTPDEEASVLLSDYVTPSTSWQDVYIPVADFITKNPNVNLKRVYTLRFLGQGTYSTPSKLFVEELEVIPSIENPYNDAIKVNQIGYRLDDQKIGIIGFEPGASTITPTNFNLVDNTTDDIVFSGPLVRQYAVGDWGKDMDEVYHADFSSYTSTGEYRLEVPEIEQVSQVFKINDDAYNEIFRDALRFFYYARSGEAIIEPFAEGYSRQAFYENETAAPYDYKGGTRDVSGGWFDAGDLHKDIHAQVEPMWFLLETLESFEDKIPGNSLNIPESQSSYSDLYELIKFKLDWMIKMQNPDGSVHFWINYEDTRDIDGIGTVSDISSTSAAILAASFAKAYPLFKAVPELSDYADELLERAELSWEWLKLNPDNIDPINPLTGTGYAYSFPDEKDAAIRAYAAIELFNATEKTEYNEYFTSRFSDPLTDYHSNMAWGGVIQHLEVSYINLGYIDYINSPHASADDVIIGRLKDEFLNLADWMIERVGFTTYNVPIAAPNHMWWMSTAAIITHGYLFDQAFQWTGDVNYKNHISNSVDWTLGRNPVNRIFVSGYGDNLHGIDIYSFYWEDLMNAPPGYLSGCINATDGTLTDIIEAPWKRFLNVQLAPIMEPGIYWNAQLAWLMGYKANNAGPISSINKLGSNTVKIFPNPSNGEFFVEIKNKATIDVYSANGKLVFSDNIVKSQPVNLNVKPGIYLIKVTSEGQIGSERILIK